MYAFHLIVSRFMRDWMEDWSVMGDLFYLSLLVSPAYHTNKSLCLPL